MTDLPLELYAGDRDLLECLPQRRYTVRQGSGPGLGYSIEESGSAESRVAESADVAGAKISTELLQRAIAFTVRVSGPGASPILGEERQIRIIPSATSAPASLGVCLLPLLVAGVQWYRKKRFGGRRSRN